MFRYLVIFFTLLFTNSLVAEDLLTLKQQLDRLQREVSDLSKSVYQGTRDNELLQQNKDEKNIDNEKEGSRFTAFDLRIYDLEKDIKKLNASFEELTFQIEDLAKLFDELNLQIQTSFAQNQNKTEATDNIEEDTLEINNEDAIEDTDANTLGSLVISTEDLSDSNEENNLSLDNSLEAPINISPEDQFQAAFDLLRAQKFNLAKKALIEFIENNKDNKLSGSAHYWLGEIYILKKEFKDAALVLAEGYQNYPESIKAPDMLYKLSNALVNIDKDLEACNILKKLSNEFPKNQLSEKSNTKYIDLNCDESIQ